MHEIHPIGVIRSPHQSIESMPIQPKGAAEVTGQLVVEEQYVEGLKDLEGFSHVYLLYSFHQTRRTELQVIPFMDDQPRGVFATRSPLRPNHIGLSIVRLQAIEGNCVTIQGVDVLDGTPLLDIKPYIAKFDGVEASTSGWMQASDEEVKNKRSDERFK
ncbi:tRNA (N6-threonylcarbamoyladenosine(37)-N6)-methyltransferase TrmO [Marinospirillum perlucidum]|uniref:tRNA (N6-threonylcarbamoyladenosine(37)-N6)-methyltransferase TrmO n=1 Tax=Marinospirillum perlucidum TaxID=1982602 RepID=UPI000DF3BA42|nr:tRNA (N6-threonylcarbamoyladenosine(37)-N6)-methyltransferase TrmO [Marinospirillum perlucidum]